MTTPPTVRLERGELHQRAALDNLVQLYIHDFTDFLAQLRVAHVPADRRTPSAVT